MIRVLLAVVTVCAFSGDAFAFGKKCGGFFSRGSSCSSGSCSVAPQANYSGGVYATGGCASGNCGPVAGSVVAAGGQVVTDSDGVQWTVSGCETGKCVWTKLPKSTAASGCPCAANGGCPCATVGAATPPKTIQAYGRTYTLVP